MKFLQITELSNIKGGGRGGVYPDPAIPPTLPLHEIDGVGDNTYQGTVQYDRNTIRDGVFPESIHPIQPVPCDPKRTEENMGNDQIKDNGLGGGTYPDPPIPPPD